MAAVNANLVEVNAMPYRISILAALIGAAASASAADAQERDCRVAAITGTEAAVSLDGAWRAQALGPLPQGADAIRTGASSRVEIACAGGVRIAVGVQTRLQLTALDEFETTEGSVVLDLVRGIVGLIAPAAGFGDFTIRTPVAIASVRSTEWLVERTQGGGAAVFVREGDVLVEPTADRPVRLEAGEGIDIDAAGEAGPVKQWGEGRSSEAAERVGLGRRRRPRLWAGAALAAIAATLFALWRLSGLDPVFDGVERASLDARFRLRGPIERPDEPTITAIGPITPLRAALSEAIERVSADGAAAVVIDLLLLDATAADDALAAALASAPAVLAAAATSDARPAANDLSAEQTRALGRSVFRIVVERGRPSEAAGRRLLIPNSGLAPAAPLGHANIVESPDRVAREVPLYANLSDSGYLPAAPLVALRLADERAPDALRLWPGARVALGPRVFPTDAAGRVTLNHYGGRGAVPTVSLLDLIEGDVDPRLIEGRAVFIGGTAESLRDVFATPLAAQIPGVEVLATLYANLVEGALIRRGDVAALATIVLAASFAAAAVVATRLTRPALVLGAGLAVVIVSLVALQGAFALFRLWLDATAVTGAAGLAAGAAVIFRYRAEGRRSARVARERDNLSRSIAPALAPILARDGGVGFDGREQPVAVLFVDVVGYTALVERRRPAEVARFMRRLHELFERQAMAHGGVVIDYLGDGAMIVFGVPDPGAEDAASALACARALLAEGCAIAAGDWPETPAPLRVSLHAGRAAAAVVGGARQGHVTVTGDTVNTASRLQETAKAHGVDLAASRAVFDAAGIDPGAAGYAFLTAEPLRGRRAAMEIWARREAIGTGAA